jgi:tRNA A-37 threonylcarbamoyl transferase component Bud32
MLAWPDTHPDPAQLHAFGLGRLVAATMAVIEEHVSFCDSCCEAVKDVSDDNFVALLRDSFSAGPDSRVDGSEPVVDAHANGASQSEHTLGSDGPVPEALAEQSRYRVLQWLGSGGMGAVYLAEHMVMERRVALKVIRRDLTNDARLVDRFHREVRAAARLSHPNIVAAFDAERAGLTHYLVMEFVEGTDLARWVKERGPMAVPLACDCVRQAALGLQHAHEHGMVHRDIKPQNLMLTTRGQIKILDFGLARFASEVAPNVVLADSESSDETPEIGGASRDQTRALSMTKSGIVLGTADYIAPEQADDSNKADQRADIYSLGCTLYYLLTGNPPFPDVNLKEKLLAHAQRQAPAVSEFRMDVPSGLEKIVKRMMAKNPAERYSEPAAVAAAIAPFVNPAASGSAATIYSDARIVVATTVAGVALIQATPPQYPDELIRLFQNQTTAPIPAFLLWVVGSLPCVVMWMLGLLALRSRRPWPNLREVATEPGMAACGMAALGMTVAGLLTFLVLTIPGNWHGAPMLLLRLIPMTSYMSAVPVVATWGFLVASGRWRPEPTWIDRVGRVLGCWLISVVLLTSGGALFWMTAALTALSVVAWMVRRLVSGRRVSSEPIRVAAYAASNVDAQKSCG